MKRIIFVGIAALIIIGVLFFIAQKTASAAKPHKAMFCTTYPIHMFAKNIAGDSPLTVRLLIPPDTGCPHDYSLTPVEMLELARGNTALVKNGAGLDDLLCESAKKANPKLKIFDSSKGIQGIANNAASHLEETEEHAEHEGHNHEFAVNPHFFASPFTAKAVVANIASALREFDPENADIYSKNEKAYIARLDLLCKEFLDARASFAGAKFAIQHDIFDYLALETGLVPAVYLAADGEVAPSPAEELRILKKIKDEKVKTVFTEKQYSSKWPERVAKDAGVEFDTLDSFASGPLDAPLDAYEKVMRQNLETMKRHFAK